MSDNDEGLTQVEQSLMWLIVAMKRIDWAAEHFHKFQSFPEWEGLEEHTASGDLRNENGANIYSFFVTRGLKTAVGAASLALRNWNGPDGFIPCEALLRTALIGSSKALYLLGPDEPSKRDRRIQLVYESDRNAKDFAIDKDRRLRGEKLDPLPRSRGGVDDSKIIRDALDGFVDKGNCQCGLPECPQEDLEGLRHRLLQVWWIYSSVSHANLWHLELARSVSLDGEQFPAGDFGTMAADITWVICKAVETLYRRYDVASRISPLTIDFSEIVTQLKNT